MTDRAYSTEKIKKEIDFQFTEIETTIEKYANWFLYDLK